MKNLPSDPMILLSYINTLLRDNYDSLEELCEDRQIDRESLEKELASYGFEYNPSQKRFW